jgi:hypothetical protein
MSGHTRDITPLLDISSARYPISKLHILQQPSKQTTNKQTDNKQANRQAVLNVTCRYHEPRKRGKYEKKNEWLVVSRKL